MTPGAEQSAVPAPSASLRKAAAFAAASLTTVLRGRWHTIGLKAEVPTDGA
jgi:hypothetical protein